MYHSSEWAEYDVDTFSYNQLMAIRDEPMLEVERIAVGKKAKKKATAE